MNEIGTALFHLCRVLLVTVEVYSQKTLKRREVSATRQSARHSYLGQRSIVPHVLKPCRAVRRNVRPELPHSIQQFHLPSFCFPGV